MVKNTMVRKMGRIKGAPRLMAMPEPILAPMTWPAAIISPAVYNTLPPAINRVNAVIFDTKFMIRVVPVAFVMSMPMKMSRAPVQNAPVPGPKNPS